VKTRAWGRTHHRRITNLFITGNLIAQWNSRGFVNALVMATGVISFFLGLSFFIIDTQPIAVWLTILLTSLISYALIAVIKDVSSSGLLDLVEFGHDSRSLSKRFRQFISILIDNAIEGKKKKSRDVMLERQRVVGVIYKLCSDRSFM